MVQEVLQGVVWGSVEGVPCDNMLDSLRLTENLSVYTAYSSVYSRRNNDFR
eukprot:m.155001 g.155001  ORF g.155001 m.155001 type:complete len:51 (+) comp17921_c0_seq5:1565-1717(+)